MAGPDLLPARARQWAAGRRSPFPPSKRTSPTFSLAARRRFAGKRVVRTRAMCYRSRASCIRADDECRLPVHNMDLRAPTEGKSADGGIPGASSIGADHDFGILAAPGQGRFPKPVRRGSDGGAESGLTRTSSTTPSRTLGAIRPPEDLSVQTAGPSLLGSPVYFSQTNSRLFGFGNMSSKMEVSGSSLPRPPIL